MIQAYKDLGNLPRSIWVLSLSTFINRMGTMVLPFLVLYLNRAHGLTQEMAASVLSVYGIGALIMGPVAGGLCDRFGATKILPISLACSSVVLLLYPLANGYAGLCIMTMAFAVFNEMYRPAMMVAYSELVTSANSKQAFALNRLAINLGMSAGPAIGGLLVVHSFHAIFFVDALTSLAGAAIVWYFFGVKKWEYEKLSKSGAVRESPLPAFWSALKDRRTYLLCVALSPAIVVFFQHESTIPLVLVSELGLSESLYGLMFTLNGGIIIIFEIYLNSKMANWKNSTAMALGALLIGIGFSLMAVAHTAAMVLFTVVVWTVGEMILFPSSSAYMTEISPTGKRGAYMGVFSAFMSLCFIVAPMVGTQALRHVGSTGLWAGCFVVGLISSILLFYQARTKG